MKWSLAFLALIYAFSISIHASTVKWIALPHYDKIEPYCDGIYLFKQGLRIGLMDATGAIIPECECDSLTPMTKQGYSLLLDNIGENEASIVGIFSIKSHDVKRIDDKGFVVKLEYAFFNEDRLPVRDSSGNWGFLGIDGSIATPCVYRDAWPFSSQRAPVRLNSKKGNVVYIRKDGKMLHIDRNLNQGVIGDGTPFFNDNMANVAVNGKFARIKTDGKIKEIISEEEYYRRSWVSEFWQENKLDATVRDSSLIGAFLNSEDAKLLKSQIVILANKDNQAIARMGDKTGILQLIPHDFSVAVSSMGRTALVSLKVEIPDGISFQDLELMIDKGDGRPQSVGIDDCTISDGGRIINFEFKPNASSKSKNAALGVTIISHGLTIWKEDSIIVAISKEPEPPVPEENCNYCRLTISKCEYSGKHPTCTICGLVIDRSGRYSNRCEGNGSHRKCTYKSCKKYIYSKGNAKNKCPGHKKPNW